MLFDNVAKRLEIPLSVYVILDAVEPQDDKSYNDDANLSVGKLAICNLLWH